MREMSVLDFSTCSRTLERPQNCDSTAHFEPLMRNLDVFEASDNRLHLACQEGHLEIVNNVINKNSNLCTVKENIGLIPLHIAAMKGKVEIVKLLVDACPESVKEATAMGETCLHLAVVYNKVKVFQYLVKWLKERIDNGDLINRKGRGGNTVLHLATSRKQLQTLKILLDNESLHKMVEVNAKNSGGFTPLDILDVLPYSRKIGMEISKILRQAGAMRARDIADQSINCGDDNYSQPPPHMSTIKSILKFRRETYNAILLVTATLLTTIAFLGGFYNPNGALQLKKHESILTRLFILFNSTGFISSGALVIFLLHEFPLKPWSQISVLAMFGAYICSIMAVSPNEAWAMLWLAIPFLLLAAGGKFCGLGQ